MRKKFLKIGDCVAVSNEANRGFKSWNIHKAYIIALKAKVNEQWNGKCTFESHEGGTKIVVAQGYKVVNNHGTEETHWHPKIISSQKIAGPWDEYLKVKAAQDEELGKQKIEREFKQKIANDKYTNMLESLRKCGIKWRPTSTYTVQEVHISVDVLTHILEHTLPLTSKGPANE